MTPSRAVTVFARGMEQRRFGDWAFEHYQRIAPASFVGPRPRSSVSGRRAAAAATA